MKKLDETLYLPNDIYVFTDPDLDKVFIGKTDLSLDDNDDSFESLNFDSEGFLKAIYVDPESFDVPESFDQSQNNRDFINSEAWRNIISSYEVKRMHVVMPDINKYGLIEEAERQGASDFLRKLCLIGGFVDFTISSRPDDGSSNIAIYLSKKNRKSEDVNSSVKH